jgi:CheY-like chemotaxis protein
MANRPLQPASRIPPRILIVEDDLVIALMVEEIVRELGYTVSGVAGTIATAHLQIARRDFDAVLLDIDLGGEYHPETADILLETGVPFAFVTGYDYVLEPRHEGVPLLEKPFKTPQLRVLLEKLVGSGSATSKIT